MSLELLYLLVEKGCYNNSKSERHRIFMVIFAAIGQRRLVQGTSLYLLRYIQWEFLGKVSFV